MITSSLNPYGSIGAFGAFGGATPFATQPYAQFQPHSPMGGFGTGSSPWASPSPYNVQPLQQVLQLLQVVPQQLQQLHQLQQQHLQQLQQLLQIVPQQLQQIQQLLQFVPQQIQQLQQQLQAQQPFGQSAGVPVSSQFNSPFSWPSAQGTNVM
jgi:7-keto-8-aminopelargonate synthetase-like enzyme